MVQLIYNNAIGLIWQAFILCFITKDMNMNSHRVFEKEVVDSYPGFIACINSGHAHAHSVDKKQAHAGQHA